VCVPAGHHPKLIPHGPWALVGNPNQPDGLRMVHLNDLNDLTAEQADNSASHHPAPGRTPRDVQPPMNTTPPVRSGAMPIAVVPVPYGQPAARALLDAVVAGKHGDPLAPVTVVVPTNYVGVAARRLLAGGTLGRVTDRGEGVAGVTFVTAYRLAELLGAPRLAGAHRRPVSTPVLAAAVRAVLTDAPGMFAPVANHPATEAALVDAYRELSVVDDAALDALVRTGRRAADVVRITRRARAALAPAWYDERDLMDAAVEAIEAGIPLLDDLGAVVVHLPQELSAPAAELVTALSARAPVAVIAGLTGRARADAPVRTALARAGVTVPEVPVEAPAGTRVVSASDPDDEVRAVVRLVVDAVRDGVPLERMAVLYGAPAPYARLVHEHLDGAGIPHNGAAVRTLAESVLGRAVLGLLALPDRDFHRHDVTSLLASTPVFRAGRPVPAARWERITRVAGIVRGPRQWHDRLERNARTLERSAAEERAVPDREPHPEHFERELAATRDLQDFVATLVDDLTEVPGRSWRDLAGWAEQLVRDHLAPESRRTAWPEPERQAAEKIEAALERLAGLDAVEAAPGVEVFRRALELELEADLGRVGRFGDGILMGHVALGLGLDLDRVFVCGLAEGLFPTRVRDDSLLPDAERRVTEGELPLRSSRVDDDHRRFLAALASASGERVLFFPRGDLRRTTERTPSRFLLDAVAATGDAAALDALPAGCYAPVPSFAAGLARVTFPATEQEHRLRVLLDHTRAGRRAVEHELHELDLPLRRGLDAATARAGRDFTRFDGNLSGFDVGRPTDPEVVVSPTRLQTYAANPFDYFLDQVLHVDIPELPEERYELSPLDRGNLVHETLDDFLREVLERSGGAPAPDAPWTASDRARLRELGEARCAAYEAQGLTGRRLFWHRDQRRILADLDRFLTEDATVRAGHQLRTVATELRFGFTPDTPPVELRLSDGRTLRFRGAADRVDRTPQASLWVIDYKTGWPRGLDADDPTARGTMLQLPVYAHAARASFGAPDTPVGASYWYVSSKGGFRWAELVLTPEVDARVDEVLRAITGGIDAGLFPCRVDPPTTWTRRFRSYTDPDARGTRDRYREWQRKRDAPVLHAYVALAEPEPQPDDVDGGVLDGN
jgi:ATP-dependent helicase/nuclease subunit B